MTADRVAAACAECPDHPDRPSGFLGVGYHDPGCHSERCGDEGCDCSLMRAYLTDRVAAARCTCGAHPWAAPEDYDHGPTCPYDRVAAARAEIARRRAAVRASLARGAVDPDDAAWALAVLDNVEADLADALAGLVQHQRRALQSGTTYCQGCNDVDGNPIQPYPCPDAVRYARQRDRTLDLYAPQPKGTP